jgi:hypothetical protein
VSIETFRIVPLPVASGVIGLCRLPGAAGDLPRDLAAIAHWGPSLALTLTPLDEAAALGLPDPARLAPSWRHFPIPDFGTPPPDADWHALRDAALAVLQDGGRVLIHCRGGLGRTGMVALGLMIAAGEEAAPALARLRAARPGAIETDQQMDWALGAPR